MVTVNTRRLVEAIEEAGAYSLPDMSVGTEYLYSNLYARMNREESVRLSELDFDAFTLDDVGHIEQLYDNTLEAQERTADALVRSLLSLSPVAAAAFV